MHPDRGGERAGIGAVNLLNQCLCFYVTSINIVHTKVTLPVEMNLQFFPINIGHYCTFY